MNVLKYLAVFILGAGAGAFATYEIMKHKNEEVLEVIEYDPSTKTDDMEVKTIGNKPNIMDFYKNKQEEIANNQNYIPPKPETPIMAEPDPAEELKPSIYSIGPDEFGELEEYDKETLWLFADNVLTDSDQNILGKDEVMSSVSEDYISYIGEYEDEVAYVRNDLTKTDYEILTDHRKYHEALRES